MLKFYEIPCESVFTRAFTLEEDGKTIGGAELAYVPTGDTSGRVEVRNFRLDQPDILKADLLAGAVLNAACNTEVETVRTCPGAQWARFGLKDFGAYLESRTDEIVFDSVCNPRAGADGFSDGAGCDRSCGKDCEPDCEKSRSDKKDDRKDGKK